MTELANFHAKHRLENKLRLWETPGFSQFLQELDDYVGQICHVGMSAEALRNTYKAKLKEIEEKDNIFKQGELEL